MTHRCGRSALAAGLLVLPLGAVAVPLARASIDSALTTETQAALAARGLGGVSVTSSWASLTLHGPAANQDGALAVARTLPHHGDVESVTYVVTDAVTAGGGAGAPSPSPSTSPSPTTSPSPSPSTSPGPSPSPSPSQSPSPSTSSAVPQDISVGALVSTVEGKPTVILTGSLATEAQHQQVLSAAVTAYGATGVTDRTTLSGGTTAATTAAVGRFAAVVAAFAGAVTTGSAQLSNTTLTVVGIGKDAAGLAVATSELDRARASGVTVAGSLTAAAAPSPGGSTAALTAQELQARLVALLTLRPVTFVSSSPELTPSSRVTLDQAAALLLQAPSLAITVAGHTDSSGNPLDSLPLSRVRAFAVRAYLVSQRVSADRLTAVGYGDAQPVAPNSTAAGRAANRRVELLVKGR